MSRRLLWSLLATLLAGLGAVWSVAAAPRPAPPAANLPNDPYLAQQWGLAGGFGIHATDAWTMTTGAQAVIAVLDSGFDLDHPDLVERWESPYNFLEDAPPAAGDLTDNYGTALAGIIGGTGNNGLGIAGVTWRTRLMPLRVISRHKDTNAVNVAPILTARRISDALDYAAAHGANVAVFGFSLTTLSDTDKSVIQQAIERNQNVLSGRNLVVVAPVGERAAGAANVTPYPAALDGVIGVTGILTDGLALQVRSSGQLVVPTGGFVDLAAPGDNIMTTFWDKDGVTPHTYQTLPPGTLYAAGFVAGAAALVLSIDPTLGPGQVETILKNTARDLGAAGRDDVYGYGLVNAVAAVRATRHWWSIRPNQLVFPPQVGATLTITNTSTLAASWTVGGQPDWVSVGAPVDGPSWSTVTVSLRRVPSCTELAQGGSLTLTSTLPLSYGPVEMPILISGICQTPGSTPTPPSFTPLPTLTPTPGTPMPSNRLFLPLLERRCDDPGKCTAPR